MTTDQLVARLLERKHEFTQIPATLCVKQDGHLVEVTEEKFDSLIAALEAELDLYGGLSCEFTIGDTYNYLLDSAPSLIADEQPDQADAPNPTVTQSE